MRELELDIPAHDVDCKKAMRFLALKFAKVPPEGSVVLGTLSAGRVARMRRASSTCRLIGEGKLDNLGTATR